MTINLSSEMDQFVKELVVAGKYPSEDDAVAEGLRLLMSREQLKAEVAKGIVLLMRVATTTKRRHLLSWKRTLTTFRPF